jgi:hypothetical protein
MDTLPERIDWLWFLGYDIDSDWSLRDTVLSYQNNPQYQ